MPFQPPGSGGEDSRRTRGSWAARPSTISAVRSVDPSSSTRISISIPREASRLLIDAAMARSSLRAGMRTETAWGSSQRPVSPQPPKPGSRYSNMFQAQSTAGTVAHQNASQTSVVVMGGGCSHGWLDRVGRSAGPGAASRVHTCPRRQHGRRGWLQRLRDREPWRAQRARLVWRPWRR